MARRTATPVFLERRSYRARRVKDAVRLLPVVGVILWIVPLLWPVPDVASGEGTPLSHALRYVFAVWLGLIALTLLLWALARRDRGLLPEDADSAD